jgi:deazaflavin-dependent oxidoreductase (nitroreductase family)
VTVRAEQVADEHNTNSQVIGEFRANSGRLGGAPAGTPVVLVHHIGARSGIEHVTPLAYTPHRDGRYIVVASNGGSSAHPSWYHNLKAHPRVQLEVHTETFTALAQELTGAARARLWPTLVATYPSVGAFQAATARRIPVILLSRQG